jgi:hypothetical protein
MPAAIQLDDTALDQLADELAERILQRLPGQPPTEGWLPTPEAAAYLGGSAESLRRLAAERALDFSQTVANAPCYFRRSDLDAYREMHLKPARIR